MVEVIHTYCTHCHVSSSLQYLLKYVVELIEIRFHEVYLIVMNIAKHEPI